MVPVLRLGRVLRALCGWWRTGPCVREVVLARRFRPCIALSALFHLFGSLFRWPVVIGLVYVFFFEILVAILPGSLKLLSLTFYARSLMYNEAVAAGCPGAMLEVSAPVSNETAWCVLIGATVGFTLLGMKLFARAEHRDDV